MKKIVLAFIIPLLAHVTFAQSLPDGFTDVEFSKNWNTIVGIDFDEKGRMYGWEKSGRVYVNDDGERSLLLDISEEVSNFRDHGLLGFVVDPDFYENGYFYVYYALDLHYYRHFGTPSYHPDTTIINTATIGRVVRFTADSTQDNKVTIPNSRKILIGEDLSSGVPILFHSHDGGTLLFGDDGSLLVSTGDGGSHKDFDKGGEVSYAPYAIAAGIIDEREDVGAYRSQQVNSLNGKILRIDPETGDGLPGNPYYDVAAPRANASRVYALGCRNPFRMQLQRGTGSHYIADGNPGRVFIADVGNWDWEEFNVLNHGGTNFGWPFFEGIDTLKTFAHDITENPFATNPLYHPNNCDYEHFTFQDLLHEAQKDSIHTFPNPCDPNVSIREHHPVFFHSPPMVAYSHANRRPTRTIVPGYDDDGNIFPFDLHLPNAPAVGDTFHGACASAVVVYDGHSFPEKYQGKLFMGDCTGHWIRVASFEEETGQLTELESFQPYAKSVICMEVNPVDGCIYYVSFGGLVRQICFGGNVPPQVKIDADTFYGPSPLTVNFTSEGTIDPNGDALSYHWDFGNGQISTEQHPTHTFTATSSSPQAYEVTLAVTDSTGLSKSETLTVSLNNTPPQVDITSFEDGDLYSISSFTWLPLEAEVTDEEHDVDSLSFSWQTFLHHNTHFHPEPIDNQPSTSTLITPVGCDVEAFYYRIRLTVSDPAGLSTVVEQMIYPYCGPEIITFGHLVGESKDEEIQLNWTTLSETRIDHMYVERYDATAGFTPIGEIEAAGDHMGSLSYTYRDLNPVEGKNVYRIRVKSLDGVYARSEPLTLHWPPPRGMDIYPNPASSVFYIDFKQIVGEASLTLTDLTGKLILQQTWDESGVGIQTIYLQNLQPGIYFYNLNNGAEKEVGKLVKRRF